ncbi:MAG: type II secretion system F family protein, partial [Myxococcales bacterium]|nr:type II secretion system F family protein [Myxococcales bacterium]
MAEWTWEGKTRAGEIRKGVIEAETEKDVHLRLRQQNIQPNKVRKKGKKIALPSFGGKVSAEQLVVFVRQFSTMIDAGLPLVQCLDILSSQEPNKFFKKVLYEVKESVEAGATEDHLKRVGVCLALFFLLRFFVAIRGGFCVH